MPTYGFDFASYGLDNTFYYTITTGSTNTNTLIWGHNPYRSTNAGVLSKETLEEQAAIESIRQTVRDRQAR